MKVYQSCPVLQSGRFWLRLVELEDCSDLLKVYSDSKAVPLFNSDNCHGDDFFYQTEERMARAIAFWLFSYQHGFFVRWSIVDRQTEEVVGTVEIFRREAEDAFTDTALLRLDLRSDYEKEETLRDIFTLLIQTACEWFECRSITTKAVPAAVIRRKVLKDLGFVESSNTLKGHDGTAYKDYFVYEENA